MEVRDHQTGLSSFHRGGWWDLILGRVLGHSVAKVLNELFYGWGCEYRWSRGLVTPVGTHLLRWGLSLYWHTTYSGPKSFWVILHLGLLSGCRSARVRDVGYHIQRSYWVMGLNLGHWGCSATPLDGPSCLPYPTLRFLSFWMFWTTWVFLVASIASCWFWGSLLVIIVLVVLRIEPEAPSMLSMDSSY